MTLQLDAAIKMRSPIEMGSMLIKAIWLLSQLGAKLHVTEVFCFVDTLKTMDTLMGILVDLGIPEELLDQDTLLRQDLQLDSTETVELALGLKRQLGVNVKLESRQDMTLAQVCSLIEAARLGSPK